MVDVAFTINPDFTIVAVQFKGTAVMLGVSLFVGNDDGVTGTIRLKVDVKKGRLVGIDDTEDAPLPDGRKDFNLGADAIENLNINARDVLVLDNGHVSRF